MPKKEPVRPSISSPFGPVKTSRGPDLVRSDRFTFVDGIKDCIDKSASGTQPASGPEVAASTATKTTRRISASFPSDGRPAASPTVASSSVNASTRAQNLSLLPPHPPPPQSQTSSRFLRKPSFPSFGRSKSSKSLLPTSSTAAVFPGRGFDQQGEDDPPSASRNPAVDAPPVTRQASKLPKSRTMNVLHDLKNSISRQNLSARFNEARRTPGPPPTPALPSMPGASQMSGPPHMPEPSHMPGPSQVPGPLRAPVSEQMPAISRKPVPSRTPVPTQSPRSSLMPPPPARMPPPPSRMPPPPSRMPPVAPQRALSPNKAPETQVSTQAHLSGPPSKRQSASSVGQSDRSTTPEPDRAQVIAAQPMEYWTGRFSRLNDIYMGRDNAPEVLLALRSGLMSQNRSQLNPHSISEEDARHLHIFAQLDFLCATQEAKQSLREFQQAFARRFNRSILLPEGCCMDGRDRGLVSRFFGNRRSSGEGCSISGQRGSSSSHTAGSNVGSLYGRR